MVILTETRTVQTERGSGGRLALLGDAAHVVAPTSGSGGVARRSQRSQRGISVASRPKRTLVAWTH